MIEAIGTAATFRAAVEEGHSSVGCVHRVRKGTGQLRNQVVRTKEIGCSRLQKCTTRGFEAVIKFLEARMFPVDQAVSLTGPLEQAADALRSWSENPSRFRNFMPTRD